NDSAPEQGADVGTEAVNLALFAVESESKEFSLGNIEVLIEALFQRLRFAFQTRSELWIIPHVPRQPRSTNLSIIGITLNFAGCTGSRRKGAVSKQDGVPGVFPALIVQADIGFFLVFNVAVAIGVAVAVNPFEGRAGIGLKRADQLCIAGPALI